MNMKNRIILTTIVLVGVLIVLGAALGVSSASAQQPTSNVDDEVIRISKNLYCPVCTGIPLDVCETQACVQWRALIKEKLLAGENEAQIRAYFIEQYGERVLGAPPAEGFNLSAYVFPALALLGGLGILFFTMRGWLKTRPATQVLETIPPVSSEYAERIARELRERE